ncbi:receptor expression-enhancing protein 2 isoform X7 [Drosophila miranda]|uniref:receptor expression-enhancing protein 2 isoform X7 n=1 Tax=Drosophila miranda TaxID=7229 RepID=UPI0007E736B9|nr:receptor expression-enhancing protein 2 isoform X7 [Drosophila miranda]
MSRPFYQQEPIFYQRPVNIKRLRHPAGSVYGRSYSLEEEHQHQQENVVPVYPKFIYANQRHPNQLPLYQLGDSLSSLDSDFVDDYNGPYIVEQPVPPPTPKVVQNLNALGRLLDLLQRWPLPCLSFNTACICSLIIIFLAPRTCAQSLLFPAFRLFFGTLYPAYASYKAVRTKNVKEYVKWMMYWIVFAFFTCIETFTDIFISWFPFYYEVKVVLVFWLLSPATKGSSTLYRKFVHPMLTRHEQEIDEYLTQATERGYSAVLQLGSKGVNYATNVIMQTAIKTFSMTTPDPARSLQNSQSASDLSAVRRNQDMMDGLEDWLPRSNSLSGIESYAELEPQRRGVVIQEMREEEPPHDAGAARLRDLPARRAQPRRAAAATSRAPVKRVSRTPDLEAPGATTQGVRARRRLREPTPDVDVEND